MADIEAIVVHGVEYKDSSKILNLYSNQGHFSVMAHGVKKHNNINRFISQNCTIIKLDHPKKNLQALKDGSLVEEFKNIKSDPFSYAYMTHILELLQHVVNEDADHQKMYSFVKRLLHLVNDGLDPEVISFIYELKLLFFIGYGLNFKTCSVCDENTNLVFSITNGGLVCADHLNPNMHSYGEDIYGIMKQLYYIVINDGVIPYVDDTTKTIIRHIIDVLYEEFVSYHSKSLKIIQQFKKY